MQHLIFLQANLPRSHLQSNRMVYHHPSNRLGRQLLLRPALSLHTRFYLRSIRFFCARRLLCQPTPSVLLAYYLGFPYRLHYFGYSHPICMAITNAPEA